MIEEVIIKKMHHRSPRRTERAAAHKVAPHYECEDGKIDRLCTECGEPVTMIMGPDATICEMCKQ